MEHRGACSADDISGDGAGVMTQIPWALIKDDLPATDEKTCGCAALPRCGLAACAQQYHASALAAQHPH